jgi:hypothetical protein
VTLRRDPEKAREWQRKSAERAAGTRRAKPPESRKKPSAGLKRSSQPKPRTPLRKRNPARLKERRAKNFGTPEQTHAMRLRWSTSGLHRRALRAESRREPWGRRGRLQAGPHEQRVSQGLAPTRAAHVLPDDRVDLGGDASGGGSDLGVGLGNGPGAGEVAARMTDRVFHSLAAIGLLTAGILIGATQSALGASPMETVAHALVGALVAGGAVGILETVTRAKQ